MSVIKLEEKLLEAAEFLRLLGSHTRLNLLCCLVDGSEVCVSALAELTGYRMPTVSQQLSLLRSHGIVSARKEGTVVYYRLVSAVAKAIIIALHENLKKAKKGNAEATSLLKAAESV